MAGVTLSPYNLWDWWAFATLDAKRDLIKQLLRDGWLKSLPPNEQFTLFEFAPEDVLQALPKLSDIHSETLNRLKINHPRSSQVTISAFLGKPRIK